MVSEEAVFRFEVLPPWYRTVWAYILYFLLYSVVIYLIVKYQKSVAGRQRQQLIENQEIELLRSRAELNEQRLTLEQENMNIMRENLEATINLKNAKVASNAVTADKIAANSITAAKISAGAVGAEQIAANIGYPVLVRPSYVLGGRGMEIVYDQESLRGFIEKATAVTPNHPVLIDKFLDDAIEIDVDALYDGTELYLAGVMEHIEEAGIHSGDSACVLPSTSLDATMIKEIRTATEKIAADVGVRGLINIQFAVSGTPQKLYVLEANPRASRNVPFVAKATGVQLAKAAAFFK